MPAAPVCRQCRHQETMLASRSRTIGSGSWRKAPSIGQPQYSIPRARKGFASSYSAKFRSSIRGRRLNG